MGDSFPYLDIVVFAMVAGFILLRLRAVLGRRTGTEKPPPAATPARRDENVIALPERAPRRDEAAASEADPAVAEILRADPHFDPEEFLDGAKAAYEMIVTAYANGDTETLKPLLSEPVYQGFAQAIEARKRANQTVRTTFVAMKEAALAGSAVNGSQGEVTVRFVAELINVTLDAEGKVVEGDPSAVKSVTDIWTFARDLRSRDPNWQLVRTGGEA
jgi:predicted lipid-binding transport protein (Tim44 family)